MVFKYRMTLFALCLLLRRNATSVAAQTVISANASDVPADLNGSNFTYPWPIGLFKFTSQQSELEMAFMDIPQVNTSTFPPKTAVLLHGKNFCAATWEATARALNRVGYRVILPDQVGFCKSTKPESYQFSLAQLAQNTRDLLSALGVERAVIVGHSMGGMLAVRLALLFPEIVSELVLVDPLGLEDWMAAGVPYRTIDRNFVDEKASNYTSIRKYEQSTYYVGTWTPEYDVWVNMLADIYGGSQGTAFAYNMAQTTDMVLTQPIVYELDRIRAPRTLLVVGDKDTTAIGKAWAPPDVQKRIGHYEVLGKLAADRIPNSTLAEFPGLGHAPHIQDPRAFRAALFGWLKGCVQEVN